MGNVLAIYDDGCLNQDIKNIEKCSVYSEHLETMKFVNQLGKVLEKSVYQNFNVPHLPDGYRISWYQLLGQCIKHAGQSLPLNDPFRTNIITVGRAEKLIGQMENEFASVCNSLLLKNIQEIRLFNKVTILSLHKTFSLLLKEVKVVEKNVDDKNFKNESQSVNDIKSPGQISESSKSSKFNSQSVKNSQNNISKKGNQLSQEKVLMSDNKKLVMVKNLLETQEQFHDIHNRLHESVIYVYEMLSSLKNKLPAIIEFQLEMNHYSNSYLEYILESFRENKSIKNCLIPLKTLQSELNSEVPDYRASIEGNLKEADISYVLNRYENDYYQGNKCLGIPFIRNQKFHFINDKGNDINQINNKLNEYELNTLDKKNEVTGKGNESTDKDEISNIKHEDSIINEDSKSEKKKLNMVNENKTVELMISEEKPENQKFNRNY